MLKLIVVSLDFFGFKSPFKEGINEFEYFPLVNNI